MKGKIYSISTSSEANLDLCSFIQFIWDSKTNDLIRQAYLPTFSVACTPNSMGAATWNRPLQLLTASSKLPSSLKSALNNLSLSLPSANFNRCDDFSVKVKPDQV